MPFRSCQEHSGYYAGGQVGGAVLEAPFLPGGAVSREAGWATRAGQAGLSGAAYGAGYGLGSGTDTEDRLRRAGVGAVTGGATGAVASPVVDLAGATAGAAGRYAGDVYRAVRGEPAISDEAARRVAEAVAAGPGLSAADRDLASQAGLDFLHADTGPAARDLAREAAARSPQAAASLRNAVEERFAAQGERASRVLDALTPPPRPASLGPEWSSAQADELERLGRSFVDSGDPRDVSRLVNRMTPDERTSFARGYASELSDRAASMPENRDLLDQAFVSDPRRTAIALGPDKARQLEAYLRLEGMANQLHGSLRGGAAQHAKASARPRRRWSASRLVNMFSEASEACGAVWVASPFNRWVTASAQPAPRLIPRSARCWHRAIRE